MGDKGIGGFAAILREKYACIDEEPPVGVCSACDSPYSHEHYRRGFCPRCGRYIPV